MQKNLLEQKIGEFIAKNDTKTAIALLLAACKDHSAAKNDSALLSARLSSLLDDRNRQIISQEGYEVGMAKLNSAITAIVSGFDEADLVAEMPHIASEKNIPYSQKQSTNETNHTLIFLQNMEPITTNVMINAVVNYFVNQIKANKSVQDFLTNFTDSTVAWIRPLFLKEDNSYEKIIADLLKNPESDIKQQQVKGAIASHIEDNASDEAQLKAMYDALQQKAQTGINIVHSKNVVAAPISAGSSVIIGDNNTIKP